MITTPSTAIQMSSPFSQAPRHNFTSGGFQKFGSLESLKSVGGFTPMTPKYHHGKVAEYEGGFA